MKHVHHDMIVAWAADPSRVVEVYCPINNTWKVERYPIWSQYVQHRFKPAEPKYIVVNGIRVPEPVRERLEDRQLYWLADPTQHCTYSGLWTATTTELYWLSLGLIHLTKEAAQTHIDAMLLPSRTDK